MPSSDVLLLSSEIREEAVRLGFFYLGIAPVHPLPYEFHFLDWLRAGFQGEMQYLERQAERRRNPGLVLEGTRSLLVAGMNYHTDDPLKDEALQGKISRYAWGDDYHEIIRLRLDRLLSFIQKLKPAAKGRCYVDTGPVMEKIWGAQTSLGWIGKHTNLISGKRGSWFFLGIILLDIELDYDSVRKNHCGDCTRCIRACPTGAIVAPYVLDARRCISYLTIELRGPIPLHLRPLIGNRIYGCDDCQEICPWNRFPSPALEKGFYPRSGLLPPNLLSLASISTEEFNAKFKESPIRRTTRDRFVRNVMIALGNSGKKEAVPVLEESLADISPLVRSHAAWALGHIGFSSAEPILQSARSRESDPLVIKEMGFALEELRSRPKS